MQRAEHNKYFLFHHCSSDQPLQLAGLSDLRLSYWRWNESFQGRCQSSTQWGADRAELTLLFSSFTIRPHLDAGSALQGLRGGGNSLTGMSDSYFLIYSTCSLRAASDLSWALCVCRLNTRIKAHGRLKGVELLLGFWWWTNFGHQSKMV